jgi:cholesterol oxidase
MTVTTRQCRDRRVPQAPGMLTEHVDALVVGSGFGGSVAAYRLAAGGRSVAVFERGHAYPPGGFARTPAEMGRNFWDPSEGMYGLFDAWNFRGMEGVVSSGLGGGSLIYANVLLRKDPEWFVHESPIPGGGYEHWPFSRADLEPHYDNVEQMMRPTPYPYRDTLKTVAMRESAEALGLSYQLPPLAITFSPHPGAEPVPQQPIDPAGYGNYHGTTRLTCSRCGECDLGCNLGAKNTLDHTYLSAARHQGADLRLMHEVRGFRPLDGGGFEVRYVVHTDDGTGVSTKDLPLQRIRCTQLILGAGTFGSTFLLLRSRSSLPGLSPMLGKRFSGNGDLLTLLLGARTSSGGNRPIHADRGPVITSAIRVPDRADGNGTGRGYYVEDAGYPSFANWLIEFGQLRAVSRRGVRLLAGLVADRIRNTKRSNISAQLAAAMGDGRLSSSSLPLLGMGRDVPDGVMTLQDGRLAVDWTLATSTGYFSALRETMRTLATHLDADFQDNPLWWLNRVITVHPLGGAPVGRHPQEGVCDSFGEVFGFPGLHVLDGAAMPGPVGANPALTIAALSDRACDRMLDRPWPRSTSRARTTAPMAASGRS